MVAVVEPSWPRVRAMQREDLARVLDIEVVSYEFCWTPGIFRDCIKAGHECWVLETEAGIIGYGVLAFGFDEAHLLNLCIAQEHQSQGHGRHLLRRMIDLARWHGVERLLLEVRPSNLAALRIYEAEDFFEIGTRPGYYPARRGREDAIVMSKRLRPQAPD